MTGLRIRALALAVLIVFAPAALAQERAGRPAGDPKGPSGNFGVLPDRTGPVLSSGILALLPPDSVTEHTLDVDGSRLAYAATAGTLNLYDQNGDRSAAIFYTAYVLKGGDRQTRPVTFVFNGGPGAASAFLHLGLVGPRLLDFGPDGRDGANAQLRDNPQTWLTFTDLVLIDPVGTGWSRAAKAEQNGTFWGVQQDAQALAKAIALYVAHAGRSNSPKYLLGESYGGFRAVKVARALQQDQGLFVFGIVMVSPLLEGMLHFGNDRFALGAALQLPSLAATELDRRHALTEEAVAAAERFAMTEYLTTLAGPPPEGEAGRAFYARVAQMTGLPIEVVAKSRGFVRGAYTKRVREANREVVSVYDASFATPDPFPESDADRGHADAILDGLTRAYGGAFAAYARNELGFRTEITYTLLAREVSGKWDWQGGGGNLARATVSDDLRELLALNPSFRLLVTHGYSDLVIPYAVSRYVIDHLPRIGAPDRVQLKVYRGGHMPYLIPSSRLALTADAKAFYGAPSQ